MPRKKIKHTQIPSERVRKSTLKRRLDSLFKKANELSILCEVELAIIVHNPHEGSSTMWPSHDRVMAAIGKFLSIPERERLKKMVLQEKFLMDKVQDMADKVMKLEKKNEEKECAFLMNQFVEGMLISELDVRQLNGLNRLVDEKLKKLQNRNEELELDDDVVRGQVLVRDDVLPPSCLPFFQMDAESVLARTPISALMEQVREDRSHHDLRYGVQSNFDLQKGTNMEPGLQKAMSSFAEGNQGAVLGDFNHVWPAIFSP